MLHLAGLPAAELVFALVDPTLMFEAVRTDGSPLQAGDRLAVVSGRARSILRGERTALNFLQYLSGIATQTRRYVDAVAGSGAGSRTDSASLGSFGDTGCLRFQVTAGGPHYFGTLFSFERTSERW